MNAGTTDRGQRVTATAQSTSSALGLLADLVQQCHTVTRKVHAHLAAFGIEDDELLQLDHFGVRTESRAQYAATVEVPRPFARWVHESDVNGRPISVLLLDEPIRTGTWVTPFLEIIAPKPGKEYTFGVEHAEFVTALPLDDVIEQHPEIDFDRSGMAKSINPELSVLGDQVSFRLHQVSLGVVVALEKALGANSPGNPASTPV